MRLLLRDSRDIYKKTPEAEHFCLPTGIFAWEGSDNGACTGFIFRCVQLEGVTGLWDGHDSSRMWLEFVRILHVGLGRN